MARTSSVHSFCVVVLWSWLFCNVFCGIYYRPQHSSAGLFFQSCLWFCSHRGVVCGRHPHLGRHPRADTPWEDTSWADPPGQIPPGQTPPYPRWLLQRTVRILLECIIVLKWNCTDLTSLHLSQKCNYNYNVKQKVVMIYYTVQCSVCSLLTWTRYRQNFDRKVYTPTQMTTVNIEMPMAFVALSNPFWSRSNTRAKIEILSP